MKPPLMHFHTHHLWLYYVCLIKIELCSHREYLGLHSVREVVSQSRDAPRTKLLGAEFHTCHLWFTA
jgi:hypothetical protein